MEQLGISLEQYTQQNKRPMKDGIVSIIGEQLISAIEILHSKSLLHR